MKKIWLVVVSWTLLLLVNMPSAHAAEYDHSNIYDVKSGDTLWKIAASYGTTAENLRLSNGLLTEDVIYTGQKLFVPTNYTVTAGDTLWKMARTFNSTVPQIRTANGLTSDRIDVGQKLKIPQKILTMQGQYILMNREEFRDWLFHHKFTRSINKIQEHHTWSPSYRNFNGANYFSLLKGMEGYHVQTMGWKTIAQNLTTYPDGKVAVSRPFNMEPEGSIGPIANSGAIMIENIGNFDAGNDNMTAEQRETIVYITAALSLKFSLTPSIDTITYHHWWDLRTGKRVLDNSAGYSVKTCPGTAFFGGNSTTSARAIFYPLVSRKMQEMAPTLR